MSDKTKWVGLPAGEETDKLKLELKAEAKKVGLRDPFFIRKVLSDYMASIKGSALQSSDDRLTEIIKDIESETSSMAVESRHLWFFLLNDLKQKIVSGEYNLKAPTSIPED